MTRVDVDTRAIAGLADDVAVKSALQRLGDDIAADAAAAAPSRSGEGAASIRAEMDEDVDGAFVNVSWDNDHFYMLFSEIGTSKMPPRPFLRPALEKPRSI